MTQQNEKARRQMILDADLPESLRMLLMVRQYPAEIITKAADAWHTDKAVRFGACRFGKVTTSTSDLKPLAEKLLAAQKATPKPEPKPKPKPKTKKK